MSSMRFPPWICAPSWCWSSSVSGRRSGPTPCGPQLAEPVIWMSCRSSRTLIASAVPPSCARSTVHLQDQVDRVGVAVAATAVPGSITAGWRLTWRVNLILTRSGGPRPCRWAIRARGQVHEARVRSHDSRTGPAALALRSLQRPIAAAVRALPVAARDSTDPAAVSPCVAAGEEAVTCVATTSAVRATTSSGTGNWAAGTAGDVSSGAGAQSRFGPSTCPRPHRGVPLCRRKAGAVRFRTSWATRGNRGRGGGARPPAAPSSSSSARSGANAAGASRRRRRPARRGPGRGFHEDPASRSAGIDSPRR